MANLSRARVEHMDVNTDRHKEDSKQMKAISEKNREATIKIKVPLPPQPEAILSGRSYVGEKQLPVIYTEGEPRLVSGEEMRNVIKAEKDARPIKYTHNGYSYWTRKDGTEGSSKKKPRVTKMPENERLQFYTVTFSSWQTELLDHHATDDDLKQLGSCLSKHMELLRGVKMVASNLHADTNNLHYDLTFAEYDRTAEGGRPYDSLVSGAEVASSEAKKGRVIMLRYADEGFPVDEADLADARTNMEKTANDPERGHKLFWDLELCRAGDRWIRSWVIKKELQEEFMERRRRFEKHASAVLGGKSQLQKVASNETQEMIRKTLRENASMKTTIKGLTDENVTLKKRISGLELEIKAVRAENTSLRYQSEAQNAKLEQLESNMAVLLAKANEPRQRAFTR